MPAAFVAGNCDFVMQSEVLSVEGDSVELVEFLTELSRLLVGAGITHDHFSRVSELAFLRAAAFGARFQNSKINQSAVSAMTGLNRTKVRKLLKAEMQGRRASESRINKIVTAWVSEAELLTSSGEPRRIRLSGGRGTFAWLAKRHGGDLPPKALLGELLRRRLVRVQNGYAILSASARRSREAKRLNQISRALASVLRLPGTVAESRSVRVSSFEVTHAATTAVGRVLLQKRISKGLRAFMADVEAACAAVALEAPLENGRDRHIAKTGVFLISQD